MGKKIFIIAGEASGDLHGKNLVKALLKKDSTLDIAAYGGPKMESAGAKVIRNYEAYAFMGFYEVAKNIKTVLSNIRITQDLILAFDPDMIILIDFPGFNIRVAKALRERLTSCKFYYYIAPQVWAWKSNRVHILNKLMDRIFVILPFEKQFFAKYAYEVEYVGHPLMDEIQPSEALTKTKDLIAVLPGSRKQEIQKMLPIFVRLAKEMPEFQFEVSIMSHITESFYGGLLENLGQIKNFSFSKSSTYNLIERAEVAIVTSGTATLETALLNTPQVVAYKTSSISYWIAKRIVDIKYISLVNLILDRPAITELIQKELNIDNLKAEVAELFQEDERKQVLEQYDKLRSILGGHKASDKVAEIVLSL